MIGFEKVWLRRYWLVIALEPPSFAAWNHPLGSWLNWGTSFVAAILRRGQLSSE